MLLDREDQLDAAARIILRDLEGGDKVIVDTGGTTKWGISERAYPDIDIPSLDFEEAKQIFEDDYWHAVKAQRMGFTLGTNVADAAFNMGVGTAVKLLQRALGNVAVDSRLGPKTMDAVDKADYMELVAMFCTHRVLYYQGLRHFDQYGKGWIARVFRLNSLIQREIYNG